MTLTLSVRPEAQAGLPGWRSSFGRKISESESGCFSAHTQAASFCRAEMLSQQPTEA